MPLAFIISLFTAQHVSDVSTAILKACDLFDELLHGLYGSASMCVGVALWWCGFRMQAEVLH